MSQILRTATFRPNDPLQRILEDLACPVCGFQSPDVAVSRPGGNRIRVFCDCCGTFVTIQLTDAQRRAFDRSRSASDD